MKKEMINNEIKNIYEANNFNLEQTLQECLQKGLVKSKKQLISKLVYLKVYQKQENVKSEKVKEPTKKDIIHNLELITGLDLFGLIEAKKDTLIALYEYLEDERLTNIENMDALQ